MESGASDLTVISNQEGAESAMVLDPSTQASLQRASSVVSENTAVGDDLSAGMESSLCVASSKNPEITEAKDDPSPGMESSLQTTSSILDPVEDKQSSKTGSTSSPQMKVNPFIKDLSGANGDLDALAWHCSIQGSKLKQKLDDGLQEKAVYAFLKHDNMIEAQAKVQELFYLFEAIEFVISTGSKFPNKSNLKADYLRLDIYYHLLIHALSYATKLQKVDPTLSHSMIEANLLEYFEATDFMVFLINKVQEEGNKLQEEGDIMYPSFTLQKAKALVNKCVRRYEEETISTFIFLVVNDKDEEAEDLFNSLLEHMKPSDIINCGRVYNYALQKAHELLEVYTLLSSPHLSQRYKDVIQCNNQLNGFAKDYRNQVKVRRFLVDLYLRDVDLKQKIDWEFVEQHDYPYLIKCVWENNKRMMVPNDVKHYNWTPLQRTYVLTSSAAIVGGQDIMKHLLEAYPALDVNEPYKGVAALHIAVIKGNEEVIKCLLKQKDLDINVRTGKEQNKNRWELPLYQTALHIATTQGHAKVVKLLCDVQEPHQQRLKCHEQDGEDNTPLDILYNGLYNSESSEIERILLSKQDVQNGIDRLYRNRQVLVDAVNTILVGAALIAGVTFAGWLQPPLGYAQYYDLVVPYPAPPDTYDSYLAVQDNLGVKAFALFNSLSFFFAIATVIVGADAAFPSNTYQYIGHVVETMHLLLRRAITFLMISLVCVLGAFGSAAIVVLPPSLFFRKDLVLSIILGGSVCGYAFWQLLSRHSERVQRLNACIRYIIKFTNVF